MPKFLKHIFFTFLIAGFFSTALWAGNSMDDDETFIVQQIPVKEDASYVKPKKYDEGFKEKYKGNEYIYDKEQANDTWLSRLIDWIEETAQEWFNLGSREEASDFVKDTLNIVYVIVILLVVFFIVRSLMNGEGRWVFGKQSKNRVINYEDVNTNIHITDFNTLINEATTKADYRLAIRYQYLNMLKKLDASAIIAFDPEKTNLDYTYEITDEGLREQFQYTSYLYNYVWYGEFDINEAQYQKAQESFNVLLKNVAA